ncbi:MAG: hypothetical protein QOK28_963 [Actinomycetota bacterium]|jgi:PAS domain S-box-containing protein
MNVTPGRESLWQLIADSSPHAVWVTAADGRVEYFNRRAAEYSAPSDAATSDRHWLDAVHPDDVVQALTIAQEGRATQTPFAFEARLRRADGTYHRHAVSAVPIEDPTSGSSKWIGTATDTEDTKSSASESSALLEALQAAAPIAIGFVDLEQRVVQANDEFTAIGGHSVGQSLRAAVADALPTLWPQIEPSYRSVIASGETVENVSIVGNTLRDREQIHAWVASCYPVRTDGELLGVGIVAVDVTELAQAKEFRSALLTQVADGVYIVDSTGCLVYMNGSASKMLGWSEEELRGKRMHDLVHFQRSDGSRVPASECELLVGEATGRLVRSTTESFTRKDGSIFPVAYSSMPLRIGSDVEGSAVVFRDLSAPAGGSRIRMLLISRDVMVSEAFQLLLDTQEGLEVVGSSTTSADGVASAARLSPDVVLVDFDLPDLDGVATTRLIGAAAPESKVILLTESYDDSLVELALKAGCAGVVDKERGWVELIDAVRSVFHGQSAFSQSDLERVVPVLRAKRGGGLSSLTGRERDVLEGISEGLSNRAIAGRLGVTPNTIRNHVQRILYKLGLHSKLEAVVLAQASKSAE